MELPAQKGFTLAELLLTLAISAVVVSIGLPSLTQFTKNSRQVAVVNDLLADFHYARDLAITSGARVTICPSADGVSCSGTGWQEGRIVFIDTDANQIVSGGDTVRRVSGDLGGTSVTTAEFGSSISFRPNGRAMADVVSDNTGEFMICDDRGSDYARALIIDFSGRPRVSHEDSNGSAPSCPPI